MFNLQSMNLSGNDKDISLLSSIREGDINAFNALFTRYYPMLCAYGHKFVALEDAEECVQDAMLWLWENREVVVIQTTLSSYIFSIVHHRCLNRIVQNEVKCRAENYFYEEMKELIEDSNFYNIEELTHRIQSAIKTLPESYREAFLMHRFRDMTYKEIADALNISPKTVDYRIQQALKQLRIDLKDYLPLLVSFL